MNNQFPALLGSSVILFFADQDTKEIPVVGWMNLTGQLAQPVCPVPGVVIGRNAVLRVPDIDGGWYFCHPEKGAVFSDYEAMAAHMEEYLEENPMPAAPERGDSSVKTEIKGGPDTRPLHFGSQTYKSKSFWHWPDANAVFEIEGEQVIPSDARAVKIKREEFAQLKRDGAYKIDPHAGVIEEDEPAKPEEDFGDLV